MSLPWGDGAPGALADDELPTEEGHLGLQLLRDSVQDVGGMLELVPNRPQGTRLRAKFLESIPGL